MKSKMSFVGLLCLVIAFMVLPLHVGAAIDLVDGEYTISYTVLHSDNDSASIANDYWDKPAKLFVSNGQGTIQMTINKSAWVTEFKVNNQDVKVISQNESADKRTVEFPVTTISNPITADIHVVVKDIQYDHGYKVRFSFDQSSLHQVKETPSNNHQSGEEESTAANSSNGSEASSGRESQVANPQTGDTAQLTILVLLVAVTGFVLMRNFKLKMR
ncbi:heme uptake protein IsdC [Alkalihalobacillus pseudalcaliphilus]|uniref:heme uptake protein IsdC n=1 Tax=Alkalihalobacillus pseudalcaliphilus TaxID=79884 RepID=UPI00069F3743|nr:heme uptake protein IsdC [Alkalihalobacillus pseudalcaliphilus]